MVRARYLTTLLALSLGGCADVEKDDHDHDDDHDHGVTTSVVLTFTPDGGGDALTFSWSDPENDGDPIIDAIVLDDGTTYALSIALWNDLEDPAEDVTEEVEEGATEHQFFFTGDAVASPATGANASALLEQSYDDEDSGGLPIGLASTIETVATGTASMTLTLRHMPPEDGQPVKVAGLAEEVATGGFAAIGGDNDVDIDFEVTVE